MYNLKELTVPILCGVSGFTIWFGMEPLIFKYNNHEQTRNFRKYIVNHKYKSAVIGYFASVFLGISIGVLFNKLQGPIFPALYKNFFSSKLPKIKKLRREGYNNT
jgi:phosphotransferase system  glucose/maltose/N-acetylglucosamine-specific IIC component